MTPPVIPSLAPQEEAAGRGGLVLARDTRIASEE